MDDPPHTLSIIPSPAAVPYRDDCWTEEATRTLIDAWGEHYLDLNRGSLRQKHWQEVADAVNAKHGNTKKTRRTDVQCKNRIDTLKKKYKIEKARVSSCSLYVSRWPFFRRLDSLIGPVSSMRSSFSSTATVSPVSRLTPAVRFGRRVPGLQLASPVPVAPRSTSVKRLPASIDDTSFLKKLSAAAAEVAENAAEDSDDTFRWRSCSRRRSAGRVGLGGGFKELTQAITTLGEIYERVEGSRQQQMIELEKQKMQFAKELEIQRTEMLVELQLEFERSKRHKRHSNQADSFQ